jgi:hypothetical protein
MALLRVVFGLRAETFWNKQVADRILYYVKEVSFPFRRQLETNKFALPRVRSPLYHSQAMTVIARIGFASEFHLTLAPPPD